MLLSVVGGVTIGMGKIVTTLFALHLGASSAQLGMISAMESLGMLLVTIPAGFAIHRYGARRVYALATLGPLMFNLLLPWMRVWYAVALLRGLIGLCIPFRIISMSSSFLEQLRHIGSDKAGWYRASQSIGAGLIGPLLGGFVVQHGSFSTGYVLIGLSFLLLVFLGYGILPDTPVREPVREKDEDEREGRAEAPGIGQQLRIILADAGLRRVYCTEHVSGASTALFATFIIMIGIQYLGLSQMQAVSLVTIQGIASILALFTLGRLLQGISPSIAYPAGFALMLLAMVLLGSGNGYWPLVAGAVSLSLATATVHMVNMRQLAEHPVDKSKIAGLYNLSSMSGSFLGSFVGGFAGLLLGQQAVFLLWIPALVVVAWYSRG